MTRLFDLDMQLVHDTLLMALSVGALFLALSYLLFDPVRALIADRQQRIAQELEGAKAQMEEAQGSGARRTVRNCGELMRRRRKSAGRRKRRQGDRGMRSCKERRKRPRRRREGRGSVYAGNGNRLRNRSVGRLFPWRLPWRRRRRRSGWMPHWKTGCWMRRCGKWRRAHGRDSAAGLRGCAFFSGS